MTERRGYRGYIATRPVRGVTTPQRVQNLVVRDYCTRRGLTYLMSVTEYAMPGCFMMLENALRELPSVEGIVFFSAFMLPRQAARRREIYSRILEAGGSLHAALENISLAKASEIERLEDLLSASFLLDRVPLRGRYDKTARPLLECDDPFIRAIGAALASPLVTPRT